MNLGVLAPGVHRGPDEAARRRRAGGGARLRRGLLAGPSLPADLLSALGSRPARAGAVHRAVRRVGRSSPRSTSERSSPASRCERRGSSRSRPRRSTRSAAGRRSSRSARATTRPGASTRCSGSRTRPRPTASRSSSETVSALRALFGGDTWPGGTHVPALTGPLLPPGSPQLWVGGRSEAVLGVAARVADAWNGWGDDVEGFAARARRLRELAERPRGRAHVGRHRARGRNRRRPGPAPGRTHGEGPVDRRRLDGHRRWNCARSSPPWARRAPRGSWCSPPGRPTASTSSRTR